MPCLKNKKSNHITKKVMWLPNQNMKLIQPTTALKSEYLAMLEDWKTTNEKLIPFPLRYDTTNFEEFIEKTNSFKEIQDPGFVHHSTFWLINEENTIVGVSNLRHYLNESLLIDGGHIGYGIRPSYRKRGYATKILELSLLEAKKLGIKKAMVACNKDNIGSIKTILNNGGELWKDHKVNGVATLNFWIAIN